MTIQDQISRNTTRGLHYEDENQSPLTAPPAVRIIAYYLPQFHPIPENDRWWGKGFTEWTNVTKAIPRYAEHYQPRLPGELGFYDLRIPDILHRQAELAKKYGVHGFCFHHYWFNGKALLDGPLKLLLSRPDIDIPFCINWANESWTRRWDGQDKQVLIKQVHSAEDDINFAKSIEPFIQDPRYIRVNGRPLIMLYRPVLFPDPKATVERWRKYFTDRGLGNPYLLMPQVFEQADPRPFGMDAAAGFPPHKFGWDLPPLATPLHLFAPDFRARVFAYDALARSAMAFDPIEYKLFPGVCPDWDNDARKPGRGVTFLGSTPGLYGIWLAHACRKAMHGATNPDERIVFVNAWNEWGEGAYLEPDVHRGYAYLRETARVLSRGDFRSYEDSANGFAGKFDLMNQMPRWNEEKLPRLLHKVRVRAAGGVERLAKAIRPA